MIAVLRFILAASLVCIVSSANALCIGICDDGGGGFVGGGQRTVEHATEQAAGAAKQTFQSAADVIQAARTGNVQNLTQELGKAFLNSPTCLGCGEVARTLLSQQDQDLANEIVGRGILILVSGGSLELVGADAVATVLLKKSGRKSPPLPEPGPAPAPVKRSKKQFETYATCLATKDGKTIAAYTMAPQFKDLESGRSFTYPSVDIRPGDAISIRAPICGFYNKLPGYHAIESAKLVYRADLVQTSEPSARSTYLYGIVYP